MQQTKNSGWRQPGRGFASLRRLLLLFLSCTAFRATGGKLVAPPWEVVFFDTFSSFLFSSSFFVFFFLRSSFFFLLFFSYFYLGLGLVVQASHDARHHAAVDGCFTLRHEQQPHGRIVRKVPVHNLARQVHNCLPAGARRRRRRRKKKKKRKKRRRRRRRRK